MATLGAVIDLRLTDPDLDFWIDVRVRQVNGSWVVVADLASAPEVAAASRPDLALVCAIWPLGAIAARRLAESAAGKLVHNLAPRSRWPDG